MLHVFNLIFKGKISYQGLKTFRRQLTLPRRLQVANVYNIHLQRNI